MRLPLLSGYVFKSQARTLDLSAVPNFDPRRLLSVINLTAGQEIYALAEPGLSYTAYANGVLTLACDTRPMSDSDTLFVMYEDGATALPPDAATNTKLEALRTFLATAGKQDEAKAVLQSILSAIQAQRVETIWTDDTGARFIRLDTGGTISWTNVAGNPSAAPGAGARPDSDSSTVVSRSTYRATAGGTGFASGDILDHLVVTDGDAGDLVSNFWINVTAGSKITAPSASAITPLAPLPDGAATAARQDTAIGTLASLLTGLGTPSDADPGSDTAAGSVVALLRRGLGRWTTLLSRIPALVSGRMPVDGSGVTQPVSASALPLPAGAATDATLQNVVAGIALLATHADEGAELTKLEAIRQLLATAAQDATLAARLGTLGQKTSAGSTPVVIATDQSAVKADTVVQATATSRSGTITTGGTAQQLMPANANRRGFVVQNQSSGDLFVNSLGNASTDQNSLKIAPGAFYETAAHHVGAGAVSIIGATTGQAFYAREF